jgi:hypothetical protein
VVAYALTLSRVDSLFAIGHTLTVNSTAVCEPLLALAQL